MRLLLLGATGRTGLHLLELALERKYEVNVLVRDPAKIPEKFREKISLCEGSHPCVLQPIFYHRR
jgi:uncharacterized protein YbjT (DUF2867 family)